MFAEKRNSLQPLQEEQEVCACCSWNLFSVTWAKDILSNTSAHVANCTRIFLHLRTESYHESCSTLIWFCSYTTYGLLNSFFLIPTNSLEIFDRKCLHEKSLWHSRHMRKPALTFPFVLVDEGEEQLHLYQVSRRYQLYIILWSCCAERPVNMGKFQKLLRRQQIMASVHLRIYLSILEEKIKVPHNMEITIIAWWWTFSFLTLEGFLLLLSGG